MKESFSTRREIELTLQSKKQETAFEDLPSLNCVQSVRIATVCLFIAYLLDCRASFAGSLQDGNPSRSTDSISVSSTALQPQPQPISQDRAESLRMWFLGGLKDGFDSAEHDIQRQDDVVYEDGIPVGLDIEVSPSEAAKLIRRYADTLRAVAFSGIGLCSQEVSSALQSIVHQPLVIGTKLKNFMCPDRLKGMDIELHLLVGEHRPPTHEEWNLLKHLPLPVWLNLYGNSFAKSDLSELVQIPLLRGLALGWTEFNDEDMVQLLKLKDLQDLYLYHTNITDRGMQGIGALKKLRILDLRDTAISDETLAYVAELPNLVELHVSEIRDASVSDQFRVWALNEKKPITKIGLKHLAVLKKLRVLDLVGTSVRGGSLKGFASLSELREIDLTETPLDILDLAGDMPRLRVLDLQNTGLLDEDLASLSRFEGLRKLELDSNETIRGSGLVELSKLRDLLILRLAYTKTSGRLPGLEKLTKLRELDLTGTMVNDKSLKAVSSLQNLEILDLEATKITDAGMIHLKKLKNLKELTVNYTSIGDRGIKAAAKMPSLKILSAFATRCTCRGAFAVRRQRDDLYFEQSAPCGD
jgi:Leucine-rich repeat (LRR) protein